MLGVMPHSPAPLIIARQACVHCSACRRCREGLCRRIACLEDAWKE